MDFRPEHKLWILPGANYCVSPGLELREGALVDADGRQFPMNPSGQILCDLGREPTDVDVVVAVLSELTGTARDVMAEEVRAFLIDMSIRGLISINQSFLREVLVVARQAPLILSAALLDHSLAYRNRFPLRHYPATTRSIVRGCIEAHQGLLWIGLCVVFASVLTLGQNPFESLNTLYPSTAPQLLVAVMAFFLVVVLMAGVHELAHFATAKAHGCQVTGFYVRRGAAGLSFREDRATTAFRVVIAGPLAGVGLVMLLAALSALVGPAGWLVLGLDQLQLSWYASLAVLGIYQLMNFLPLSKDGRELVRLARARAFALTVQ